MKIYRGIYLDIETDLDNENIQAEKRIDIIDQESDLYNITLTSETVGPNILYTFTFDTLPATAFQTQIVWSDDGGLTWNGATGGTTSPQTITLPPAVYLFQFVIYFPDNVTFTWNNEDEIIDLEMTDQPVRIIVIDNSEDKSTPIRAKQAEIQIYSSDAININTFSQGGDTRFKVNYYINNELKFTGFLSLGDLSQEFMPDPNVINLVAVDGLGFLNDVPLTDSDGNTPEYEHNLLSIVQWCLLGTGLRINLAVTFNIREETALDFTSDNSGIGHFLKYCFVDAKTFEEEPNLLENMYLVLEKILQSMGCYLCQEDAEWRIVRVDEQEHGQTAQKVYRWRWDGEFIEQIDEVQEASVGEGQAYSWMDNAVVMIERLAREFRLNFKYEIPKELPCNIDLERGDVIDDSSPTEKTYEIECWEPLWSNTSTDDPQPVGIYLKRIFENDYEKQRYVVLEANATEFSFIKSSRVYVGEKDKLTFDVSRRLSSDVGGSTAFVDNQAQLRLYGDDGTFWTHHGHSPSDPFSYWVECDATFRTFQNWFVVAGDLDEDQRESKNLYSSEVAEVPVSGYIQILVYQSANYGATRDTYIDKISLSILSFINGSYQKYTGHRYTVEQDVNTRNVKEASLYLDNVPRKSIKGALCIRTLTEVFSGTITFGAGSGFSLPGDLTGSFLVGQYLVADGTLNYMEGLITAVTYHIVGDTTEITMNVGSVAEVVTGTVSTAVFPLAGMFYNAATEVNGAENPKPFGQLIAFDLWNQLNRTMVKFDGVVDHTNPQPSLIKKYTLSDADLNTTGLLFLLLHYEEDTHLCEWPAFFMECANSNIDKSYIGNSFKYLTTNE